MPKKQKEVPKRVVTRRQLSRWQRERRDRRIALLVGSLVIAVVMAVLGYGYYDTQVRPSREPALRVNNTVFDMGYFLKMLRLLSAGYPYPEMVASGLVSDIQDNELIRQGADRLGLSVSPADIDEELANTFTSEGGEGEFKKLYQEFLDGIGLSDEEYRRVVATALLRGKLREHLGRELPTVAEQAHVQGMLLEDEEQVGKAKERLGVGEDFAEVAKELSLDQTSGEGGGDLGWLPRGVAGQEFDDLVFGLEPGVLGGPIKAEMGGFWLLKVLEKDQAREIEEEALEVFKNKALEGWLEGERAANLVESYLDQDKLDWALAKVRG